MSTSESDGDQAGGKAASRAVASLDDLQHDARAHTREVAADSGQQPGASASNSDMSQRDDEDSSSSGAATADEPDDLAGLPLASERDAARERKRKGKGRQGKGEAITEAGAQAHKLGLAFERVLSTAPKHGIMEVRPILHATQHKRCTPTCAQGPRP